MATSKLLVFSTALCSWAIAAPSFSSSQASDTLNLVKRVFTNQDCTPEQWQVFNAAYNLGINYANSAAALLGPEHPKWQQYFGESYHDQLTVDDYKRDYLGGYTSIGATGLNVPVFCGTAAHPECANTELPPPDPNEPAPPKSWAYVFENRDLVLCDAFFLFPEQDPAEGDNSWCNQQDRQTISGFETRPWTLIHEIGHIGGHLLDPPLTDVTYCEEDACPQLAIDNEDAAYTNADNYMYASMHAYWENRCGKTIPTTLTPPGGGK